MPSFLKKLAQWKERDYGRGLGQFISYLKVSLIHPVWKQEIWPLQMVGKAQQSSHGELEPAGYLNVIHGTKNEIK